MTTKNQTESTQPWMLIGTIVALWGGAIVALSLTGYFNVAPTEPNLPTILAILIPPTIGIAVYFISPAFRAWVLALDPVLLVTLQSWRILGGVFVFLYLFDLLPGMFALPAGLGDMAIGLAAPFIAMALLHKPNFIRSRRFWLFHLLGLMDFWVAVTTGTLSRVQIDGWVEGTTSGAMAAFPLVVIPAFVVPAFILLHFASMVQAAKRVQPVAVYQRA